jgi:hypothetical protein
MNDAPPKLLLLALSWSGSPTSWSAGDDDKHIGTYSEAGTAQLHKAGINTELRAVEYTPSPPVIFQYTRHTDVGTRSSEITYCGAVLGENMSLLIRICLPGCLPWPERFKRYECERL